MWRIIFDAAQTGPYNMAFDQAMMEAVAQRTVPPTLRLYAWSPPCLSLGYNQAVREVALEALAKRGWDVVRRATGGKAILHTDEITYSIALPDDSPLVAGGIVESYRRLSMALVAALDMMGAQADVTSPDVAGRAIGPVCFEVPSNYEITAFGKKLIGSAQVRRGGAVLQHGTLPLFGDITRIVDVLRFDDEDGHHIAKTRVAARAITLADALGQSVSWQTAADAIADGFASTFDLILEPAVFSPDEQARAVALADTQYGQPAWTTRH